MKNHASLIRTGAALLVVALGDSLSNEQSHDGCGKSGDVEAHVDNSVRVSSSRIGDGDI